ncbi:MAG: hypothetical protein AB1608_09720 [Thermoproteota archaeon]
MKIAFAALAIFVSACLIGQAASGFSAMPQNTPMVVLSGCNTGYDCDKSTIKRIESYTINLKESLNMDSNDKKPSDKKDKSEKKSTKDKKKPVKKEKVAPKKLNDDLKKKFDQIKKKPKKDSSTQKTKHDTVKNSISNIR